MVLSMVVLMAYPFVMQRFFPAPPPEEGTTGDSNSGSVVTDNKPKDNATPTVPDKKPQGKATPPVATAPVIEVPLRELSITTPYWHVKLSNHGAVATSWILDKYKDNGGLREIKAADSGPLELIPQPLPEAVDAPLGLRLPSRPDIATQLNKTNYEVLIDGAAATQNEITINAGEQKEITFRVSTGTTTASKKFTFSGDQMVFNAEASVKTSEGDQITQLVIGSGFGDQSDKHTGSYSTPPQVVAYTSEESREQKIASQITQPVATITQVSERQIVLDKPLPAGISHIKITADKGTSLVGYAEVKEGQGGTLLTLDGVPSGTGAGQAVAPRFDLLTHGYRWAGVADHYVTMLAVTDQVVSPLTLANLELKQTDPNHPVRDYPSVAVPVSPNSPAHIFVGPKERDLLAEVGGQLNANIGAVIDYGFFGKIVRPLIYPLAWGLKTFARLFHNYGWAIIVVTILINLVLWPLRASSSKKMKRAAKHQPRMKELQEKLKKLKDNPKKNEREIQQVQQEQMALMKEANPLGGCLPLLLQLPIFWAVYMYLSMSLDVRHAPWFGWIHDLSQPDPYKILPIVMCVTMIASTQLTPQPATADPSMKMQRIMMTWLMPILLTWFFFLGAPSGLVLYWMVSNLVGVVMQLVINKQTAEPTAPTEAAKGAPSSTRNPGPPDAKGKGRKKERRGGAEVERV